MIESLKQSPILWIILTACTILSVPAFIYSIFISFKNDRKRQLSADKASIILVRHGLNIIEKLSLQYDGKSIDDLTITRFVIWNSGNKTIRMEDIARNVPLCIKAIEPASILDAEIIGESDEANGFNLSYVSSNEVRLNFEYIEPQDGIVLHVLHTGLQADLFVDCRIIGGKLIMKSSKKNAAQNEDKEQRIKKLRRRIVILRSIQLFLIILVPVLFYLIKNNVIPYEWLLEGPSQSKDGGYGILSILICSMAVIALISMYIYSFRKAFHLKYPSKLRKYL